MPANTIENILAIDNTSVTEGVIYGLASKVTQKRNPDGTTFEYIVEALNDITEIMDIYYTKSTTYPFKYLKTPVAILDSTVTKNEKSITSFDLDFLNPKVYSKLKAKLDALNSQKNDLLDQIKILQSQKALADSKTAAKIDKIIATLNKKLAKIDSNINAVLKKMDEEKSKKIKEIQTKMKIDRILPINDDNLETYVSKNQINVISDKLKSLEGLVVNENFGDEEVSKKLVGQQYELRDYRNYPVHFQYYKDKYIVNYNNKSYEGLYFIPSSSTPSLNFNYRSELTDYFISRIKEYLPSLGIQDTEIELIDDGYIIARFGSGYNYIQLLYLEKLLNIKLFDIDLYSNEGHIYRFYTQIYTKNKKKNYKLEVKLRYDIKNIDALNYISAVLFHIDTNFKRYFSRSGVGYILKNLIGSIENIKEKFKNIVINRYKDNVRILKPYEVLIHLQTYKAYLSSNLKNELFVDIIFNPEQYSTPESVRQKISDYTDSAALLEDLAKTLESKTINLNYCSYTFEGDISTLNVKVYEKCSVDCIGPFYTDYNCYDTKNKVTYVYDYITQAKLHYSDDITYLDLARFIKENKDMFINQTKKLDDLNRKIQETNQKILDTTDKVKIDQYKQILTSLQNEVKVIENEISNTIYDEKQMYSKLMIFNNCTKFSLKITVDKGRIIQGQEELGISSTNKINLDYQKGLAGYARYNISNLVQATAARNTLIPAPSIQVYHQFPITEINKKIPEISSNDIYFKVKPALFIEYKNIPKNVYNGYIVEVRYTRYLFFDQKQLTGTYYFKIQLITKEDDLGVIKDKINQRVINPYISQYYKNIKANKALIYIITSKPNKIGELYYIDSKTATETSVKGLKKIKHGVFTNFKSGDGKIVYRHNVEGKEDIQGMILIY